MTDYYQERAPEYEEFYHRPERQAEQEELKDWLKDEVSGRTILEIACGTGYWTAVAAPQARFIQATDFNSAPMEFAREKALGDHVRFAQADAYSLPDFDIAFDCGMAHFWWSHVPLADQQRFLAGFVSKLQSGAKILMIDNNKVDGSTMPFSRKDEHGNTYQTRKLSNGSEYEVVKNFPGAGELRAAFAPFCSEVEVRQSTYFWAVRATRSATAASQARRANGCIAE